MLNVTKRILTNEERQKLLHLRPSLFFRSRRRVAQQELAEGVVEELEFDISRAWNLNGCKPPCCPHTFLFRVGDREYVYAESWFAFNFVGEESIKQKMRIVLTPLTRRILGADMEGEGLAFEDSPFEPATAYFASEGECRIYQEKDMPEEALSMLGAT